MSSETVVAIQPNELPEIRSELIEWLDGYIAHHLWDAASRRGAFEHLIGPPRPGDSRILRGTEIMRLEASELVYASAGMVELAKAASSSLPKFTLQREDVPMRGGMLVFETPPARIPNTGDVDVDAFDVAAVCWGPHPKWGDEAILVSVYMDRDKYGQAIDQVAPRRSVLSGPRLVYAYGTEIAWWYGEYDELEGLPDDNVWQTLSPILRSVWLLMGQESVTESQQVQAPRAARRRIQRAGREPGAVRLLSLRRPERSSEGQQGGREYQHQWIVRGHWRQHWYPSRQVHRPIWIAPHIKGPEGAPLIGGEKVHVLR